MNIHFDYLAIAALTSILTAIPLFLMALLVGSNHTQRQTPRRAPEPDPEPAPEPWKPEYLGGYWQPTKDNPGPYDYRWVRYDEVEP